MMPMCNRPDCVEERARLGAELRGLRNLLVERTAPPLLNTAPPTLREVLLWVHERQQNCLVFAAARHADDKAKWIEDARYFGQILHFLALYGSKMIDDLLKDENEPQKKH